MILMKVLLVLFFVFLIVCAIIQRQRVRIIPWVVVFFSCCSIYFVLLPAHSTVVAEFFGVGRGADLLLYLWFAIGSLFIFFLTVQIKSLNENLTNLSRFIAIDRAVRGENCSRPDAEASQE